MKKFIFTAIVALAFISCGKNNGKTADSNDMEFDSVVVDSTCTLINSQNSPKCDISIHFQYVKGRNSQTINNTLLRSGILAPDYFSLSKEKLGIKQAIDSFVSKYMLDYKHDYGELYKQDKEHGASYNCSYFVKTKTQKTDDNVLVYIASISSYAGGAHGIEQTLAKNFNTKTGHIIQLKDIFVPGYEQTLKEIIINKLDEKFKANGLDELKKLYIFADNNVYVPDNFIIGDDKITFIYCEDEIAPHAVGEIRIPIDKSDLDKIMK